MAEHPDNNLHYETVTPVLINALHALMTNPVFNDFNLVGGTNLSLRFGHRRSDDIDLFTDAKYGSIDFTELEKELSRMFPYFDNPDRSGIVGFGRMYYVGLNKENAVKLDLMYTDEFLSKPEVKDGIRFETVDQIAAMKMEAINGGGRKKDWWDIDHLLTIYTLEELLALHEKWQPWLHEEKKLLVRLVDFSSADTEPNPRCLLGKDWDIIKINMIKQVEAYSKKKRRRKAVRKIYQSMLSAKQANPASKGTKKGK
jgi:hypothetical protein